MPEDLTTLDAVKIDLGFDLDDDAQDEALLRLIRDASLEIRRFTGRQFTIADPRIQETRIFSLGGKRRLYVDELLSEDDILTIRDRNNIAVPYRWEAGFGPGQEMGSKIVFASEERQGLPASHADWFVRNLADVPFDVLPEGPVSINATWGYEEVPDQIEYLARRTVAIWSNSDEPRTELAYSADGAKTELPPTITHAVDDWVIPKGFVA